MFPSRSKSLALILPLLLLASACDRKPTEPRTTTTVLPYPQTADPATSGTFPAPEINRVLPVYTAQSEDHWAQVAGEPGWRYEWTLEGGLFTSGTTADTIRFKAGNPGIMAVRCKITDASGRETTASRTPKVVPLPTLALFEATPTVLTQGDVVSLRWDIKDQTTLHLSPGAKDVMAYSTFKLQPTETTTYILTAANEAGTKVEKAVDVKVVPPPVIKGFTSEGTSKVGQPLNLFAEFADGKAEIRVGTTVLAASAESPLRLQVNPTTGTIYTLAVTNEAGRTATMQASVAVQPAKK